MKLSTRSRYGLRAMILIASKSGAVTSSELVAAYEDLSKKYLDRILMRLRKAGFLKSVRGQGGGYVLAREADQMRAGEIIEALEGGLWLVHCVGDPSGCKKADSCRTRRVWCRVSLAIRATLDAVSLSDLVGDSYSEVVCGTPPAGS